jgi:hypothetical protein
VSTGRSRSWLRLLPFGRGVEASRLVKVGAGDFVERAFTSELGSRLRFLRATI